MRAHRLHWFQVYGILPKIIDHINRVKDDNRIDNLRECTHSQNVRNSKAVGYSKYKGVRWCKRDRKWIAKCKYGGKENSLGDFDLEADAAKAYDEFCIKNNIHFANLNFPK